MLSKAIDIYTDTRRAVENGLEKVERDIYKALITCGGPLRGKQSIEMEIAARCSRVRVENFDDRVSVVVDDGSRHGRRIRLDSEEDAEVLCEVLKQVLMGLRARVDAYKATADKVLARVEGFYKGLEE